MIPGPGSTLGDWSYFILGLLGPDSAAFQLADWQCLQFGIDYIVEQEPEVFLAFLVRAPHSSDRRVA